MYTKLIPVLATNLNNITCTSPSPGNSTYHIVCNCTPTPYYFKEEIFYDVLKKFCYLKLYLTSKIGLGLGTTIRDNTSGGSRISRRGRGPPMWALFGENVCENERIGSHGGGGGVRRARPP